MVDLSIHGVRFLSRGTTTFAEIALYYVRHFATHLEFFLPFTFLLASLKLLLDLNAHGELVALQMAGLSKKKLLRPLFLFAAFLSLAAFANNQWIAPDAQDATDVFREAHSKKKKKKDPLYHIALNDDSELIYQNFDEEKQEFFDLFWIQTPDDVWHMKSLKLEHKMNPQGHFVDHLVRNKEGQFEKRESFLSCPFPNLRWSKETSLERFIPFENRSISSLLQQARADSADRQSIFSHLHYKMALPLLPFFILLSISPFTMRFRRSFPTFLLVALSIFAFVGLMMILQGMLILGENRVLPAYLAIWGPMAALFALLLPPFIRL